MDFHESGEAFYIAQEMEKRAISLYERAQTVFEGSSCLPQIRSILRDEREHLSRFQSMGGEKPVSVEHAQLLSARAADVIFQGGLVEAQRKGAFSSQGALLAFAAKEEEKAIEQYTLMAQKLSGTEGEAFLAIAQEEKRHLKALREQMETE